MSFSRTTETQNSDQQETKTLIGDEIPALQQLRDHADVAAKTHVQVADLGRTLRAAYDAVQGKDAATETREILTKVREADIVFHTSRSRQSEAVQAATNSSISHMGMLVRDAQGNWQVLEAVQPVKLTPFAEWKARGEGGTITIKRLGADFDANAVINSAKAHIGKPYDALFGWGDDSIYCSELVHDAYLRGAGITIGKTERVQDLDFSDSSVRELFIQRTGLKLNAAQKIFLAGLFTAYKTPAAVFSSTEWKMTGMQLPPKIRAKLAEPIITPVAMFHDAQLSTVYSSMR